MTRTKRSGRPKVIERPRKHNVYLSGDIDAHVQSIADKKFVSFSAALRIALREHMAMRTNTVEQCSRSIAIGAIA